MAKPIYQERVSSGRTATLFVALALTFLVLSAWRHYVAGGGAWALVFSCLFLVFLFYTVNYRALVIRITQTGVFLKFGIIRWRVSLDNIEDSGTDQASLWRIAGAGVHFTFIRRQYRAYFNFLEHERVVLTLVRKQGLVSEVAFSTTRPGEVIEAIHRGLDYPPTNEESHAK